VANGKVYVAAFQEEKVRHEDNVHIKKAEGNLPALAIYELK